MSIKSRKRPVSRPVSAADARIGLVLASLPGLALAADPAASPQVLRGVTVQEEIDTGYKADTVSSPKYTAPLLDTPQTITVIRKELLDDQGASSLGEALRNTPGITFTLGENGNTTAGDSMSMRGYDTSGSIFVDGIRDLGAVSRDTFNVDQVEIVKGAVGADNGRGSPTGYVNLVTKQPTLEDVLSATVAGGSGSRIRATGDLNHALEGVSGAAVRLNLIYDRGEEIGRSVAENERWGVAPALALGLGGDTRAYFNYLYMQQDNVPDGGLPTIGLPGYTSNSTIDAVADAVNAAAPVNRRNYYGAPGDFEDVTVNMFTARVEHDFSDVTTLRNTARYGRSHLEREITGINTLGNLEAGGVPTAPWEWTVSRSRQRRDEVTELLTNQTNLTSSFVTGRVQHAISTGVEFIYERMLSRGGVLVGAAQPANLYNPSREDFFGELEPSGAVTDGKTTTAAAYFVDTMTFSPRWSLNLGLRLDHYDTETDIIPAPTTPPTEAVFLDKQGNLVTGKIGLVFKPRENGSIYVAYGTSELPPGGTNFQLNATTTNIANPNLDPQEAHNIEVGTKWELLDNRLVLTAAVFDTRNKNDLATADPVTGEITQLGERKVRGVELAASGMITPAWQVSAGVLALDTEVVVGNEATTGAELPYAPDLQFTSWTTYTFANGLKIGGGARYTSDQFRNGNASQASVPNLAVNPSSWVVDLMAAYDINERLSVQLNANNVFDEFYLANLNNGGSRYTLGTPRSYLLTVRFKH